MMDVHLPPKIRMELAIGILQDCHGKMLQVIENTKLRQNAAHNTRGRHDMLLGYHDFIRQQLNEVKVLLQQITERQSLDGKGRRQTPKPPKAGRSHAQP